MSQMQAGATNTHVEEPYTLLVSWRIDHRQATLTS